MTDLIKPRRPGQPHEIPLSQVTRMPPDDHDLDPNLKDPTLNPKGPDDIYWFKEAKRPIAVIKADLSKPISPKYLKRLKDKGNALYIPWPHAVSLLDRCTGGHWDYEIPQMWANAERIFIIAKITIHAKEGLFYHCATGTEVLKREAWNKEKQVMELKEIAYGDPSSNAESMALRRAAAKFGLGRYLYKDKD